MNKFLIGSVLLVAGMISVPAISSASDNDLNENLVNSSICAGALLANAAVDYSINNISEYELFNRVKAAYAPMFYYSSGGVDEDNKAIYVRMLENSAQVFAEKASGEGYSAADYEILLDCAQNGSVLFTNNYSKFNHKEFNEIVRGVVNGLNTLIETIN